MLRGFFGIVRTSSQTGANTVEFSVLTVFGILLSVATLTGVGTQINESFSPTEMRLAEGGGSSSTLAASELTSEEGPVVAVVSNQIAPTSSPPGLVVGAPENNGGGLPINPQGGPQIGGSSSSPGGSPANPGPQIGGSPWSPSTVQPGFQIFF